MMFTIYPKVGSVRRQMSKGMTAVDLADRKRRQSVNNLLAG
ncbi:hypothetical protein PQR05_16950 [Paraburkholderia sediminicola]|uniref:Integrase n=1 Tax=Paraburkholderia metrosideri TaxID=580937 RepID=A0ABW9DVH4_9BURK